MNRDEDIAPAISVIVPAYNVEHYIDTAIKSLLSQSFSDFELIVINDGSTDSSGPIADAFARDDCRIRVIHQKNCGAPTARNRGLDMARGKYIFFMDPDDWVEPDMLGDMHSYCERHSLTLAVAGFYIETYASNNKSIIQKIAAERAVCENSQDFRRGAYRLFDLNLLYPPWNKLYLRQYLNENSIRFPDTFWDDFPFNLAVIRDIERVGIIPGAYYHFTRARTESETSKYRPAMYKKREEEHQWMLELYNYWGITDEASMEMISRRYVERLIGCAENLENADCKLPVSEKRSQIKAMASATHAREALKLARPRSFMTSVLLVPFRLRWIWLIRLEGKLISRVKRHDMRAFATLKARR
jgi:glycosyltransferase EpsJ